MVERVIKRYRPSKRFWRFSKYLFPLDRSAFRLTGAPAPKQLTEPRLLAEQQPNLVKIHDLGQERDWGGVDFWTFFKGVKQLHCAAAHGGYPLSVTTYQQSSVVGRHSCLLGPGNQLVADLGYYLPNAESIREVPFGRLNPLYWRYRWQGDLRNRSEIPAPCRVEGTAVVLNNPWCHNYYHWMLEVVPRVMMLRRSGLEADWYVVECQSRYQQRVLELLGIPRHRWIQPHYSLHLKADLLVRPSQPGAVAWQDLATALTQAATEKLTSFAKKGQRRIYISRKAATHRRIANEAELESHLKGYGFQSYSFENIDFADQLSLVNQAEVIVAVHGAALANLIFAKPGTPVVEICPIHRYNPDCFPRVSRKVGLQHATVMATSSRFRQELQVNLADMDAALSHVGVQPQDGSSSQRSKAA